LALLELTLASSSLALDLKGVEGCFTGLQKRELLARLQFRGQDKNWREAASLLKIQLFEGLLC
jgi:hypothetical protein